MNISDFDKYDDTVTAVMADQALADGEDVCTYRSSWTDSGDRGADMEAHRRSAHPDHKHVWGDSTYSWEQPGTEYLIPGTRDQRAIRLHAPQRCVECAIRPEEESKCEDWS